MLTRCQRDVSGTDRLHHVATQPTPDLCLRHLRHASCRNAFRRALQLMLPLVDIVPCPSSGQGANQVRNTVTVRATNITSVLVVQHLSLQPSPLPNRSSLSIQQGVFRQLLFVACCTSLASNRAPVQSCSASCQQQRPRQLSGLALHIPGSAR
jgi:hypothetical protein